MSRSEILDDFYQIAVKQGLISEAQDKESKELKDYKNDAYPRVGSDDISTIEALYGVKPDSIIEYENCIMEAAHPNSVIIGPAHDKINTLVENNIERQNIMCNIALKPNDGQIDYRAYASELTHSLIRIANDMDNRNYDHLRVLADQCLKELSKKTIIKEAIIPWAGIAVLLSHMEDSDQGLKANLNKTIERLTAIDPSDLPGTGQEELSDLIGYLSKLSVQLDGIMTKLVPLRQKTQAEGQALTQEEYNVVTEFINTINATTLKVKQAIDSFEKNSVWGAVFYGSRPYSMFQDSVGKARISLQLLYRTLQQYSAYLNKVAALKPAEPKAAPPVQAYQTISPVTIEGDPHALDIPKSTPSPKTPVSGPFVGQQSKDEEDVIRQIMTQSSEKKSSLNKQAAGPLLAVLPWVAGAAAVLAAIWAANHVAYQDDGLKANLIRAIKRLDELKDTSWFESPITTDFKRHVDILEKKLKNIQDSVTAFTQILSQIETPRSLDEIEELKKSSEYQNETKTKIDNFKRELENILPAIAESIADYSNVAGKMNRTWVSETLGRLGDFVYGGEKYSLFSDDIKKAQLALETLKDSVKDTLEKIDQVGDKQQYYQKKIQDANQKIAQVKPQERLTQHEEPAVGTLGLEENKPSAHLAEFEQMLGRPPTQEEESFLRSIMAQ